MAAKLQGSRATWILVSLHLVCLACLLAWLCIQPHEYYKVSSPEPRSAMPMPSTNGSLALTDIRSLMGPEDVPSGSVAVIGASGYIGSRLYDHLSSSMHGSAQVFGFDRISLPGTLRPNFSKMASSDIPTHTLQKFRAVIYLAGCTGRASCSKIGESASHHENVDDILALAGRMAGGQALIFASTSALAEGSGNFPATEEFPVKTGLLDTYSASMFARELALRKFSSSHEKHVGLKLVGLRFGTVVGVSPGQRIDLSPMAMIKSAYANGEIRVAHGECHRSFLWLEDLVKAIEKIVTAADPAVLDHGPAFEIFNLASFHANVAAIANTAALVTGARVITADHAHEGKHDVAGFTLNVSKFSSRFNFKFDGTLLHAMNDLDTHAPASLTAKGPHSPANLKYLEHIQSKSSTGKQAPASHEHHHHHGGSIPCPVCKSQDLQEVLDLDTQPLANDFRSTIADSLQCPKFPLKLMRCRSCNHVHLSTVVSRSSLFSEYLYESGTSKTLKKHFTALANKIATESAPAASSSEASPSSSSPAKKSILEIACNDGSQLDVFAAKPHGWDTYCVDPAANIVKKAKTKGHNVVVGFWGTDDVSSKLPDTFDAIVAQNVLAHVGEPVAFLKACKAKMSKKTKLYLQTSQCQMMYDGQFDTAYHEHVSFFSASSFQRAAELSGLTILEFETTPIHGISCLITMKVKDDSDSDSSAKSASLQRRLTEEYNAGMMHDFFYAKFSAKAYFMRDWVRNHIFALKAANYTIGMYGAAAKGMVLLNFLAAKGSSLNLNHSAALALAGDADHHDMMKVIDFVVDDAPLKQGRFCPGTRIPVMPTSHLNSTNVSERVAIVVLAWNFWDEIKTRILHQLTSRLQTNINTNNMAPIPIIVPFPTARVIFLDVSTGKEIPGPGLPYYPTPVPNPLQQAYNKPVAHYDNKQEQSFSFSVYRAIGDALNGVTLAPSPSARRRTLLITHIYNEEFMLPYFIRHHAGMFDHAIVIDYSSTDASRSILAREAPATWRVVDASHPQEFGAEQLDQVLHVCMYVCMYVCVETCI
jgi:nucleoside-diphosphate-sugar epimerase